MNQNVRPDEHNTETSSTPSMSNQDALKMGKVTEAKESSGSAVFTPHGSDKHMKDVTDSHVSQPASVPVSQKFANYMS